MRLAELLSPRPIMDRLQLRIADLDDEELLWAPVDGSLNVRDVDGRWVRDEPPRGLVGFDGTAEPFSTIGWRLAHIAGDALTGDRNPAWLGLGDAPAPPTADAASAEGMRAWLRQATDWWCGLLDRCTDEHLAAPMGPVAGMWGDAPRSGFLVHIYTDVDHHIGEVGVLRDLWRAGVR
jgi:hypothetical protein